MNEEQLTKMFMDALSPEHQKYSFTEEFVSDMAYRASECEDPKDFLEDVLSGACENGMVDMLFFNSDCKNIYIKHIDNMEWFKEDIEEKLGTYIPNGNQQHYTTVCWLCYEELAREIYDKLYENEDI